MRLPEFEIHRPTTVEEALAVKSRHGAGATLYAGGTELLLIMKLDLAVYSHLVDLKRITGMGRLSITDGELRIGATVRHAELETSAEVHRLFPSLIEMTRRIGNPRVRSTGTIGGNLAFADPHSDPATFFVAVGGIVEVVALDGSVRSVPVADFFLAPYTTVLDEDQLISSVRLPIPDAQTTISHRHLRFRERPAVTATTLIRRDGDHVVHAQVAIGSVCPTPLRLAAVESMLVAEPAPSREMIREAVTSIIDPVEDLDGSPDYKRHLAGEVVARSVASALNGHQTGSTWN